MGKKQYEPNAKELWNYFETVIDWAMDLFPENEIPKKLIKVQEWGFLYNKYHNKVYDKKELKDKVSELLLDDDVTKKTGIIEYVLSDRTVNDEKYLSLRAFSDSQKLQAYKKQGHKCKHCGKEFKFEEMQGDHIIPWSLGGHTTIDNLQMLCRKCNNDKGNK